MQSLHEGAFDGEVRRTGHPHAKCVIRCGRQCWQQRAPSIPRGSLGDSPSSGIGSSDTGSDQSSVHLTVMRASHHSHRLVHEGRGLWVKVNLPIFKDKKIKDAVTYHSWQWDMAIFHCLGWDNRHLLLYIFQSLQGFLGDLASSLGKDTTLSDILPTFDKDYGIIMTFDTLSKELIPSSKDQERMWLNFGCTCHSRSRYPSWSTQEGSCQSIWRR